MKDKEKEYIVKIIIDDMQFPEIGEVEIMAESPEGAKEWILDHLALQARVKKN
jgi:hypothetical protein